MTAERKIRRTTLRDVAQSCHLSEPTVSQILNNRASNFSSEETRRLVRETAERLGYQPNFGYKLMRGISTKTVALVIGHANMKDFEYIRKFIFLILERLSSEGYSVYIETMPDGWSKRQRHDIMLNLIQRGAEHFISIGKPCEWEDLDALEQRTGITMMTFCSQYRNSVNVNVKKGVSLLLEHCLEKGCKKIRAVLPYDKDRFEALAKVLKLNEEEVKSIICHHEIPCTDSPEQQLEQHMALGYEKTKELFAKEPDTDAVLYLSDNFAIGGANYLRETGRVIGKDVRLIAFNNTLAVQAYPYPISSVSHNLNAVVDCIMKNFTKRDSGIFSIDPIPHFRD